MQTLICGAIENEIQLLKSKLADSVLFLETGVGLIASSIKMSRFLAEHQVDRIIFTGTVGAYNTDQFEINQIIVADRTSLITPLSLMMKGYVPELVQTHLKLATLNCDDLTGVNVATVLEITSDNDLANLIVESHTVDVEHMELFSLASAAAEYNIKLSALLAISNFVGPAAHEEWYKHHSTASKLVQDYILEKFY